MAIVIFDGPFDINLLTRWLIDYYEDELYIFTKHIHLYHADILYNNRVHFNYYNASTLYNTDILIRNTQLLINLNPRTNNFQHYYFIKKHIFHREHGSYIISISTNHNNSIQNHLKTNKLDKIMYRYLNITDTILHKILKDKNTTTINTNLIEIIKSKKSTTIS